MDQKKYGKTGLELMDSWKFMLREIWYYKRWGILLPFMGGVSQISLSLVIIFMPKVVLDAVERNASTEYLLFRVGMAGVLFTALTILNMALHNLTISFSENILYGRLVVLWEKKVIAMDYEAFVSDAGKLRTERARQAICSPNWGIVKFLPGTAAILEALTGLLVYSGIIGSLAPPAVLLLLLIFCIELYIGYAVEKKKQTLRNERARADRKLNYLAYGLRGMREGKDIRIFSMSSLLRQIASEAVAGKRAVETKTHTWHFYEKLAGAAFVLARDGAAYVYLIYRFLHTEMSVGDFTLYFAAITGLGNWLTMLADAASEYLEINHYVSDFRKFMELKDEDRKPVCSNLRLEPPIGFSCKDVAFSYLVENDGLKKEIPVIRKLNLTIHKGEHIAIVGANGAGKSTLVKLLCGMLRPDQGSILINGTDSETFRKKDCYSLFSAVFQQSGVLPVSIAENIMLNIRQEDDMERMWKCIRLAGLEEKVRSLPKGVDTCLGKRISEEGTELSGGEEQRLLLARALYKDAPVLMLDEPTAALDPIAEHEIYQKYNLFTEGKTAVYISHRLASTRFCDRIIFLENGTIAESGTHDELIKLGGKYAEMFRLQSRYYKSGTMGGETE